MLTLLTGKYALTSNSQPPKSRGSEVQENITQHSERESLLLWFSEDKHASSSHWCSLSFHFTQKDQLRVSRLREGLSSTKPNEEPAAFQGTLGLSSIYKVREKRKLTLGICPKHSRLYPQNDNSPTLSKAQTKRHQVSDPWHGAVPAPCHSPIKSRRTLGLSNTKHQSSELTRRIFLNL